MSEEDENIDRHGPYKGFTDPTAPAYCRPAPPPPEPKPGSLGDLLKQAIEKANLKNGVRG